MSNARFWFVPLKDVAPSEQRAQLAARDDVRAADLPPSYAVPSKLFQEGIRAGHVLALHDGDNVVTLARVLALDSAGTLHWWRLPMLEAPELSATPELREITAAEAQQFKIGIDAILRDVPASAIATAEPSAPAKTYTPTGPASNVILYGPPGTGKTYSVRRRALELLGMERLGGKPLADASTEQMQGEWKTLRRDGRIVFCTFHQAFAYEEFVEGLRADTDDRGQVRYAVKPGVFKQLALTAAAEGLAKTNSVEDPDFDTRWSLLGAALQSEPRVVNSKTGRVYVLEPSARENIRAFKGSTDDEGVFTKDADAIPLIVSRATMAEVWKSRAELGDDPGMAELKGFNTAGTPGWMVYRELQKLTAAPSTETIEAYERSRQALAAEQPFTFGSGCRHFVLVIDEINRANIARVFGELITLLEPDKRLGTKGGELRVQLPSSKEWFGVPPNLHIIATMNTADRSIALMDVALRRRFDFEEMMPDAGVIRRVLAEVADDGTPPASPEVIDLVVKVFEKLNERLRFLYDREHQIGHAYFLKVRTLHDLREVFATKIIPLLQEYFFGHWDKVALALGYPQEKNEPQPRGEKDETILMVRKVAEKTVLGFDHDDYDDHQFEWEVHPAFRSRAEVSEGAWTPDDASLTRVFNRVTGPRP